jgi:hypothetical protein
MEAHAKPLIRVHDQWDGWRTGEVRFVDLHDVHWFQPVGAPEPFIHAIVLCTNVLTTDIRHECEPSSVPHRIRVCILKTQVPAPMYGELARLADQRTAGAHDRRSTPMRTSMNRL